MDGRGFRERNVDRFALKVGRIVVFVLDVDVETQGKPSLYALRHAGEVGFDLSVERRSGKKDAGIVDEEIVASAAVDADQVEGRGIKNGRKTLSHASDAGVCGKGD